MNYARGRRRQEMLAAPQDARVGDVFTREEIEMLAVTIRKRYSSFEWKSGDLLIVDNLKMAHAGMPGFGPRLLRALICNPISVPCSPQGSGFHVPAENEFSETLGAQIVKMVQNTQRATGPSAPVVG
jgi:hypothetical protein